MATALYSFLRSAISKSNSLLGTELSSTDISPFVDIMDYILDELTKLQRALKYSFITAIVFGSVCFAYSILSIVLDFKLQAILMRTHRSIFQKGDDIQGSLVDAAEFPGLFVVNSILGFLIFCVVFMIFFTVLYHPLFWLAIYENLWYILLILIPLAIDFVLDFVCEKFVYNDETMYRHRLIGQVFEIYKFITSLLEGVALEIGRVLFALLLLLLSIIKLNRPIIPQWIDEIVSLDSMYKAYVALIRIYGRYNNPVACTFIKLLLAAHSEGKTSKGAALMRHAVRKRWLVLRRRAQDVPKLTIRDEERELQKPDADHYVAIHVLPVLASPGHI